MAGRLLLLFIIAPIVELFVLIKVGGIIGVIPTVALVLLTAIIGSQLVRRQGLEVMSRVRATQTRGEAPALPMLNGAALLLAGLLLITPGLISDALGFVLLIPKLRERLAQKLLSRVVIFTPGGGGPGRGPSANDTDDSPIEGEYRRKSDQPDTKRHGNRLDRDD